MASGIYQICGPHGTYIGSSNNILARLAQHRRHLEDGKHHSPFLQRAWSKYGASSFTFSSIEEGVPLEHLIQREQFWIDSYIQEGRTLYNGTLVAGPPMVGWFTPEIRQKLSNAKKGRKLSPEQKEEFRRKRAATMAAKSADEIERDKQARSAGMQKMWDEKGDELRAKRKQPTPVWTPEMRAAAAARRLGTKHSPEAKRKISEANAKRFGRKLDD